MKSKNAIKDKSFAFAVRVVRICQYLVEQKKEYVLSKQLLRSGTSVGAMLREAEHAESRSDFSHKLAIAQKEINESMYWLLLKEANYLNVNEFEAIHKDAVEIIKLLTAILKSTKSH
jgi:four helix bundle protein